MKEILWHGRGGQGAFTAAKLLGAAFALRDNKSFALAFPSFGPERRGAPIRAFTKLDNKPIGNRSEIEKADYSVFLDDTLLVSSSLDELKGNGKIIVNTKQSFYDERIIAVDADSLAEKVLKRPITNTILLGAFSAVSGEVEISDIENAIKLYMPQKLHAKNIEAVEQASRLFKEVK